jgi:nucleoside-diphosphate-sugar epimerase
MFRLRRHPAIKTDVFCNRKKISRHAPAAVGGTLCRLRVRIERRLCARQQPAPFAGAREDNALSERILLAGCGDVGTRAAKLLLARSDAADHDQVRANKIFALRRRPPPGDDSGIEWLRGDLTDAGSLRAVLPADITQLVYLPTPDRRDEAAYRATFVDGLQQVMQALDGRSLKRVLFVSSSAVYGDHHGDWVDESTPVAPSGFNGRVLLEAEQWLATQPVTSIVLRLAGLYGPGQLLLLDRLRAGQARVPRQTTHWANRIHTDDAAAAIVHLLQIDDPQPLYLGADDTPLPLDVLYDALATMIGAAPPQNGPPPAGIGSKRLRNARLRASGFVPRWPDSREGYAAAFHAAVQGAD